MKNDLKKRPFGVKYSKKGGWTLIELCIALIALTILIGLSIQSIKPKRFMVGPFAYAAIQNLNNANNYIKAKCKNSGGGITEVFGCDVNGTSLPITDETAIADMAAYYEAASDEEKANLGNPPTLGNIDEIWCKEIAGLFTLIDNDIRCEYNGGAGNSQVGLINGTRGAGKANFQASNMVAYYDLEKEWKDITRGAPTGDRTIEDLNATSETKYKTIFIDVDGNKGKHPNKLNEDQFPVRVYITGEILPGTCRAYPHEGDTTDYCTWYDTNNPQGPWISSPYPFSYNLIRGYKADPADTTIKSERLLSGVSYQEAACRSGRNTMIPREDLCGSANNTIDPSTSLTDGTLKVYEKCMSDYEVDGVNQNSFCFVKLAKPANPGLFRLPLM